MGKIYVVGVGPGSPALRTYAAVEAIRASDVVVGYETYIGLIQDLLEGKEVVSAKMRQEIYRVETAIAKALEGRAVALVSDGDPQVYGMAPLLFEMIAKRGLSVDVEIVPGITAALAAAAKLGSPLGHDFAVLNLSDLLTPREVILKRAALAAEADYVIALYNPISPQLTEEVLRAIEGVRGPGVPVGIVKNAYRPGEEVRVLPLGEVKGAYLDMRSIAVVGNSETFTWRGYMITPRGYSKRYRI
ncbi:MAG: precorrin-3B C(17)-methyltransferase [Thermoproteus sp.]